jgi:hypothetical protein
MFKLDFSHGSLLSVTELGYEGSNRENIGRGFFKHNKSSGFSPGTSKVGLSWKPFTGYFQDNTKKTLDFCSALAIFLEALPIIHPPDDSNLLSVRNP